MPPGLASPVCHSSLMQLAAYIMKYIFYIPHPIWSTIYEADILQRYKCKVPFLFWRNVSLVGRVRKQVALTQSQTNELEGELMSSLTWLLWLPEIVSVPTQSQADILLYSTVHHTGFETVSNIVVLTPI